MLIFLLLGFAVLAVPAYAAFNWVVGSTVIQLGTLFAEKQMLYDRYRGLAALTREVSLAETLAGSQAIRDWANDEADMGARQRGIAELEHFRQSFADKSYFFAIGASGNYYFNDAANSYAGEQFRYTLSADNPRDAWYYSTVQLGEGCHLNVDNDANLGVTNVWINCVIREGRRVLGILGTGLNLTAFIQDVVNIPQQGVTSLFVDRQGQVQAHRDENLVDLRSLTAEMSAKRSIYSMVDGPEQQQALGALMAEVTSDSASVRSQFIQMGGKQVLVGVGYLDKLGWYNITLMDIDDIIDRRLFVPIGILLGVVMALVASVMVFVFKRQVLDRLMRLEDVVRSARAGDYGPALSLRDQGQDEVARLSGAFSDMAVAVSENTGLLEARVRERTEELEALAFRDGQTGLLNRRGFQAAFASIAPHQVRGLLLVDIDHFKSINDRFGHAAGDAVIIEVAARIADAIGAGGSSARWGGDEFVVLLTDSAPHLLRATAYGVLASIGERPVDLPDGSTFAVGVSIGASLMEPDETIETATEMADTALYMAKGEGRNRVVILDPETTLHSGKAAS